MFQLSFVLQFCSCMNLIAATRAEGGLVLYSLHSPPNSRKDNLLIDHISITYNTLKIQHPEAGIIICGDKNNLDEKKIISLDHNFRQVTTPGKTSGCIQLSQTYAAMITHQL